MSLGISTTLSILVLFGGELVLLIIIGIVLFRLYRLGITLETFFGGKEAKSFEKTILDHIAVTKQMDTEIQELFEGMRSVSTIAHKGLYKTALIRFNPFKDVGGNQSFSLALLDGKNSGFVISSLHTREGTRTYAKPVVNGTENGFPFTEEEKHSITEASAQKTKQA